MTELMKVLERIQAESREQTGGLRFVHTVQLGDAIRQGDVYLHPFFPDEELEGAVFGAAPRTLRTQIVPGRSRGSRHVVEGPVLAARPAGGGRVHFLRALERVVLRHPEHSDVSLPAGCYEIGVQRDHEPWGPSVEEGRRGLALALD